jgi:Rieske Fe-S protein
VSDIPVGGGRIISDQQVVVTQPAAGTFACFGAVCTHQGCLVTDVSAGTINCACHGSRFNIADGSVAGGPAPRPLPPVGISVEGDTIRRT